MQLMPALGVSVPKSSRMLSGRSLQVVVIIIDINSELLSRARQLVSKNGRRQRAQVEANDEHHILVRAAVAHKVGHLELLVAHARHRVVLVSLGHVAE